jgi:PPM family protein phosphatase
LSALDYPTISISLFNRENMQIIGKTTDSVETLSERQHVQKMLHAMKHRLRSFDRSQSPFATSFYSVANERHPTRNEDSILIDSTSGLYAVFDGVGGSAAAEIASQTAAHSMLKSWKNALTREQNKRRIYSLLTEKTSLDLCHTVESIILESDEQVRTNGAERAKTDDLATTIAVSVFNRQQSGGYSMIYGHVGDSRVYLLRENASLQRLTSDDGLLTKLVENQIVNERHALKIDQATHVDQLSEVEYSYFRLRGRITQALGGPIPPTIHVDKITIQPGDRVLLCTDGIHDNLTDHEIETILRFTPRSIIARTLVESALQRSRNYNQTIRSKPDDMSAIVMVCRF